jgi:hypothetical protein
MNLAHQLHDFYRGSSESVAFVDESFRLDGSSEFYILGIAIVRADQLAATRSQLLDVYGGESLHAGAMYSRGELASLRKAATLISRQNDGLDVIVATGIASDDLTGVAARRQCVEYGLSVAIGDFDCNRVVFDSHKNPTLNQRDRETLNELRLTQQVNEAMVAIHTYPRIEPLLGLPDVLAWTYRQEYTGRDPTWFDALHDQAQVHLL